MKPDTQKLQSIAAHLEACERTLLDPGVRRDKARVAALLAEDFQEFGSSGRVWTREAILDLLATEEFSAPLLQDFQCHWIASQVALVTYRTVRIDPESGQHSGVLRSSIWIEQGGQWRVRFHQGTREQATRKT